MDGGPVGDLCRSRLWCQTLVRVFYVRREHVCQDNPLHHDLCAGRCEVRIPCIQCVEGGVRVITPSISLSESSRCPFKQRIALTKDLIVVGASACPAGKSPDEEIVKKTPPMFRFTTY